MTSANTPARIHKAIQTARKATPPLILRSSYSLRSPYFLSFPLFPYTRSPPRCFFHVRRARFHGRNCLFFENRSSSDRLHRFRRSYRSKPVESSLSTVEAFDEIHVRRSLSKLLDRSRSSCLLCRRIVYDVFLRRPVERRTVDPSSNAQLYPIRRIRKLLSIFRPTDVLRSLKLVNTEKQKFRCKRFH